MASPRALSLFAALSLFLATSASAFTPISFLHKNTSSVTPLRAGQVFDVTGIVTSPDSVRSFTNTEVFIQDATGGINLFQSSGIGAGFHFNLGDSVAIRGTVTQFNGLTELTSLTNYQLLSTGNFANIEPLVLTCAQVNQTLLVSTPDSFPEYNEGKLIRINNVTRVGGAAWPTTCAGANSTIQISDGTATTLLFIDLNSEVCGSSDPGGPFDVIGILAQFDNSAPYSTGYEIVPRFKSDIIPHIPGPSILTGPTAVDIESTSVSIEWTTDTQSTSLVEYGLTTAYGSAAGDSTPVTSHSVPLTGLQPGKIYHYRVASTDGAGTRASGDRTFATPSSQPGQINFYFNRSIDASLAYTDTAQGNVFLPTMVINRVDQAQNDISMAVYSFNIVALADALIEAWGRGVKVRVVLDAEAGQTQADRLRAEGIPVITSTFGGNHTGGGIHHNKFFVFDGRDTTTTNDWIWSGSDNMSNENQSDANHGFEIQDYGLAQAYLTEFNEEWGSSTDTPSAPDSKMGNRKTDNTPHHFVINGIPIDLYFSPSDGTESQIASAVGTANHSIFFSIYTFTSNPIADAMESRWMNVPGIQLRGVFDASGANNQGSEWPDMSGSGADPWSPLPDVWTDTESGLIHHKYMIIDEGHGDSDPQVVTGSHNWSNAANTVNDENTLIFHDVTIANLFLQEFAERYHIAGGAAELRAVDAGSGPLAKGLSLSAPWPSPAAGAGFVEYAIPGGVRAGDRVQLGLYDLSGRLVRTLVDAPAEPGTRRLSFPATDRAGARLAAGVYFLRLNALGSTLNRKWVLVQ